MSELTEIQGSDLVKASRKPINENFKVIASDFAGTAFPVNNLVIGMKCFRTDQNKLYRYVADNDWKLELDLSGRVALIASASFAQQAMADNRNQQIDATYVKGVSTENGNIVVTRGDGMKTTIPYNDNNDKVNVTPTPSSSKEYAIIVNKAGLENGTDGVLMDTQVTINPSDHSITAATFKGNLEGNAKNDNRGQKIDDTYVKDISLNGLTITIVKGNGTQKQVVTNTNFDNTRRFSGSTQGYRSIEGTSIDVSNRDFTTGSGNIQNRIFETQSGIGAGTYGLADILQRLVNQSHWHRTGVRYSNCNCNCDCDCGDDGGGW